MKHYVLVLFHSYLPTCGILGQAPREQQGIASVQVLTDKETTTIKSFWSTIKVNSNHFVVLAKDRVIISSLDLSNKSQDEVIRRLAQMKKLGLSVFATAMGHPAIGAVVAGIPERLESSASED